MAVTNAFGVDFEYNSVDIPGVEGLDEVVNSNVDQLSIIGRDGIKSNVGKLAGRSITLHGTIISTDGTQTSPLSQWNTLLNALYDNDGGNTKTYLQVSTQIRIEAQLTSHSYGYSKNNAGMLALSYRLGFLCDSPYWEDENFSTASDTGLSTDGTVTIVSGSMGSMLSWPTITISSATGLTADIILKNNTISAVWTYGANLTAAKELVVDMENHTVTNDGSDDIANVDHPDSEWFYLRGGVENEIEIEFAGGASDAVMSIVYYRRYLTFPDIA